MSRKLPRHQDIDSQLWPALNEYNPIVMAAKLGCYASIMIVFISWLVLFGTMAAGWIEWAAWPYVVLPIGVWLGLLGLPILWKLRKGSLMILSAIVKTAEAWLARAGYSVDLNKDGYYGHVREMQVTPVKTKTTVANGSDDFFFVQQIQYFEHFISSVFIAMLGGVCQSLSKCRGHRYLAFFG